MALGIKPLAFMRTSVGIVIYAAVFYALLLGLVFQYIHKKVSYKKTVLVIFLILIAVVGHPYWSGLRFINSWAEQNLKDKNEKYGLTIPKEYFDSANFIRKVKLDTKIDVYPSAVGYQSNSWGYFGYIMYPWIYYQPTISFDKQTSDGALKSKTNARYILYDKSLGRFTEDYSKLLGVSNQSVYESKMLTIYRKPDSDFLPHIFVSDKNLVTDRVSRFYIDSKEALTWGFFSPNNQPDLLMKLPLSLAYKPTIEYKRMNPTKYRVIVHGAKDIFPIVFTENHNPDWKLYLGDMNVYERSETITDLKNTDLNKMYKNYAINENDRANIGEHLDFTNKNLISFTKGPEKKQLQFVSKNFKGTIQNDNLPNNKFYETMFYQEVKDSHMLVNNNFNSWLIDPKKICVNNTKCKRNPDGSFEIEFIIEFWPQKLTNLSLLFSVLATLTYIGHQAISRRKNSIL